MWRFRGVYLLISCLCSVHLWRRKKKLKSAKKPFWHHENNNTIRITSANVQAGWEEKRWVGVKNTYVTGCITANKAILVCGLHGKGGVRLSWWARICSVSKNEFTLYCFDLHLQFLHSTSRLSVIFQGLRISILSWFETLHHSAIRGSKYIVTLPCCSWDCAQSWIECIENIHKAYMAWFQQIEQRDLDGLQKNWQFNFAVPSVDTCICN